MIWADHIVRADGGLARLLGRNEVLCHPFVAGELALGNLRDRSVLQSFGSLPRAKVAFEGEVLEFIERHALYGSGIGYVDAHLLVSTRLTKGAKLWTRDRRLHAVALRLSVAADET